MTCNRLQLQGVRPLSGSLIPHRIEPRGASLYFVSLSARGSRVPYHSADPLSARRAGGCDSVPARSLCFCPVLLSKLARACPSFGCFHVYPRRLSPEAVVLVTPTQRYSQGPNHIGVESATLVRDLNLSLA